MQYYRRRRHPVDYLFRSFDEMPEVEQVALKSCTGKVLVIGAGSGCHSLWLQDAGLDVTSIDISEGAIGDNAATWLKKSLPTRFICNG